MCLKKYLFAMNPISEAEGFHLQSLLRKKWLREPNIKPYRLFFRLRRKLARVNGKFDKFFLLKFSHVWTKCFFDNDASLKKKLTTNKMPILLGLCSH